MTPNAIIDITGSHEDAEHLADAIAAVDPDQIRRGKVDMASRESAAAIRGPYPVLPSTQHSNERKAS